MRMMSTVGLVVLAGSLFGTPTAFGQVIQLPTVQVFSVATTVVIPDRGSMQLGGVDRASFGSTSFGVPGLGSVPGAGRLFKNRGIGSEMGTSRLNATATIINHDEWDRAILSQAAAQRAAAQNTAVSRKAAFLAQHMGRNKQANASEYRRQPPVRAAAAPKRGVIRDEEP